jgi:hypothetical protein
MINAPQVKSSGANERRADEALPVESAPTAVELVPVAMLSPLVPVAAGWSVVEAKPMPSGPMLTRWPPIVVITLGESVAIPYLVPLMYTSLPETVKVTWPTLDVKAPLAAIAGRIVVLGRATPEGPIEIRCPLIVKSVEKSSSIR